MVLENGDARMREGKCVLPWAFIVFPRPLVRVCLFVFFLTVERNR